MSAIKPTSGNDAIAAESREFLIGLLRDLREDLAGQLKAGGHTGPDPQSAARTAAIFDALLAGLSEGGALLDSDEVREYVTDLAKSTDRENEYERVSREHRALMELREALGTSNGRPASSSQLADEPTKER